MGVLEACSMNLGRAPSEKLKESPFIKNVAVKVLIKNGIDPRGQDVSTFKQVKTDAKRLRKRFEAAHGSPYGVWGFKLLQAVFFVESLVESFPDAKFICIDRDPRLVAESCMRRHFMTRYRHIQGWTALAQWYLEQTRAIYAKARNAMLFRPFISDWDDLIWFCGLEKNEQKMEAWLKPEQFHTQ